jgi:hypothetical protein
MNQVYLDSARLLTRVAPLVLVDDTFALKGGTAINLLGITAGIRCAFVIYLASHNRPVHEVLFPSLRDIREEFEHRFKGMTIRRAL